MTADRTYRAMVGSQAVELPLVSLSDDLTIALLISVDHGIAFAEVAGRELADLMRPAAPDIVVSVATMGIPLAIEASRALGSTTT
jgi:adenine/guanine phosphoribosyltransferase-like PRPP-binding protein